MLRVMKERIPIWNLLLAMALVTSGCRPAPHTAPPAATAFVLKTDTQESAQPELVPQIEIGGALLLAARRGGPPGTAELLVGEGQRGYAGQFSYGAAQWRDPETGAVLRTVPIASWPSISTLSIAPVQTA